MISLSKRIEELMEALGRLSQRERYLVAGMIVCVFIFAIFLVSWLVSSSLVSIEHRIQDKSAKLQIIIDKRAQFEEAKRQQKLSEERISQGSAIQLYSVIENQAKAMKINIGDMQSRPTTPEATTNIIEDKVEVNIPIITIDRLVQIIEQIEQRADTIAVRKLHVKKSFKDPTQLDVSFIVSNFKVAEQKPKDANQDAAAPGAELPQ